jgi:hypothetical protein
MVEFPSKYRPEATETEKYILRVIYSIKKDSLCKKAPPSSSKI